MQLRDLLYGVAIGDAVGYPLEFRGGEVNEFQRLWGRSRIVSDDTQMTLFCLEGLLRSEGQNPIKELKAAYLRWLRTQNGSGDIFPKIGVLQFSSIYGARMPGATCLSSLSTISSGREVKNNSKGNGAAMRCSVIPYVVKYYFKRDKDYAVNLAADDCLITHQHPWAFMVNKFLVGIYWDLLKSKNFEQALSNNLQTLVDLSLKNTITDIIENEKEVRGFVAEEAVALAIKAVMGASSYREVIRKAVTCCNDTDTVGAIAGALAVYAGMLPPKINLDVSDVMLYLDNLAHKKYEN